MNHRTRISLLLVGLTAGWAWAQQPLRIKRISLYKNGMAHLVRSGRIDSPLQLAFHPEEMNDVLKSFTAWNPESGELYSLGYTAGIPTAHLLQRYPFDLLNPRAGLAQFLSQIKGARLALQVAGRTVEGKLLAVNPRKRTVKEQVQMDDYRISLLEAAGSVKTVWLSELASLSLADLQLRRQLDSYLRILAQGNQDVTREISVYPVPAPGPIRVSYLQQFPVWKTSYRLRVEEKQAVLQGWALIDNPTGEEWEDVDLTLISGMPVSFRMDLYQPLYTTRSTVAVPGAAVAAPWRHESVLRREGPVPSSGNTVYGVVRDSGGGVLPGAEIQILSVRGGYLSSALTNEQGEFQVTEIPAGDWRLQASLPGFQTFEQRFQMAPGGKIRIDPTLQIGKITQAMTVTVPASRRKGAIQEFAAKIAGSDDRVPFEQAPMDAIRQAQISQSRDYFEYKFPFPIRLAARQSAFLPFLQRGIKAERLSIFNPAADPSHPLNGVRLTNDSGVPLEAGPATIFEGGKYAGEAVLDYTPRQGQRLLSYGIDYEVEVSLEGDSEPETVVGLTIQRGIATLVKERVQTTRYLLKNNSERQKMVLIEQARQAGRKLRDLEPDETTQSYYRFRQALGPREEREFPVSEVLSRRTTLQIANADQRRLEVFFSGWTIPPALKQKLEEIIAARSRLAASRQDVRALQQSLKEMTADQQRLRENLKALRVSKAEQPLRERYVDQLTRQEDRLEALHRELEQARQEVQAQEARLADLVAKLSWRRTTR
ncbi:MAG: carboxypeptidase regulatory-like domain-containing protein [Acidobacteriota bacterium]